MDHLVLICILSIVAYVSVAAFMYYKMGTEPMNLTDNVFNFFGKELLAMAAITITKNVSSDFAASRLKGDDEEC